MGNSADNEGSSLTLDNSCEGCLDVAVAASFRDNDMPAQRSRCLKHVSLLVLESQKPWTARKIGDRRGLRNHFAQQIEPLAREFSGSPPAAMTIGIVEVAAFAAIAVRNEPVATIKAT